MKLPFKEPLSPSYIYIDSKNVVHILMPIVSGTSIGLDNTCKAVYALKEFFGKGDTMNNPNTLKKVLTDYSATLNSDLNWAGIDHTLAQQKRERLAQITTYLRVIEHLDASEELNTLTPLAASYPRPLEVMLQERSRSNLYSIILILRPTAQDAYLRTQAARPLFSVVHDSESQQKFNTVSVLQQALIKAYRELTFKTQNVKFQLINRVLAKQFDHSNLGLLKEKLHEEVKQLTGIEIDFNRDSFGNELNQQFIDDELLCGALPTPGIYLDTLFDGCAPELLKTYLESPFNQLITAEQWSIATQFLLGITSLYCVSQAKMSSEVNWGRLLDNSLELSQSLAQIMASNTENPEDALFN